MLMLVGLLLVLCFLFGEVFVLLVLDALELFVGRALLGLLLGQLQVLAGLLGAGHFVLLLLLARLQTRLRGLLLRPALRRLHCRLVSPHRLLLTGATATHFKFLNILIEI